MKMLQPFMHILSGKQIVLASSSPRRKLILQNIGLQFRIESSRFEENLDKAAFPEAKDYVLETARQKTLEVKDRITKNGEPVDIFIGADTVVTLDGRIYEKPSNEDHAVEMLKSLSGQRHTVYSGVCILVRDEVDSYVETSFTEPTDVEFASLDEETIRAYVKTGEPMDKAGAYGIQGIGGTVVSAIHGDYFNVMGFPLHSFCRHLVQIIRPK